MNDEKISVNIYTGTSTQQQRSPPSYFTRRYRTLNGSINNYSNINQLFSAIDMLQRSPNVSDIVLNIALSRSNNDQELQRDPSIEPDIDKYVCSRTDENKECSICQSNIRLGTNISKLDCNHTFHYDCINEWCKYKQECPLCRTEIPVK